MPTIRHAFADDAAAICALLDPYAEQRIVLPRSEADVVACIDNFLVAESPDGEVVGAVALRDFGSGLEEIRSLVVKSATAGKGLGSTLVQGAIAFARERGATEVFALTLRPNLFERLGFQVVDKSRFPQKVWSDCSTCPKVDCCDEIALMLTLGPDVHA